MKNKPRRWWSEGKNGFREKEQQGDFILRGPVSKDRNLITVWCPYCQVYHQHSWDRSYTYKPQHRGAHCGGWSPLRDSGYFIAPIHPFPTADKLSLATLK
jgi:hypothetical protein